LSALRGGVTLYPREEQALAMQENYHGWQAAVARCRYQPG